MSPERDNLDEETQEVIDGLLLRDGDRGDQKRLAGGISKAELRREKERAAIRQGMRGFVERIEALILENDPLAQITDQLSSPLALHSLAVPIKSGEILLSMARLNERAQILTQGEEFIDVGAKSLVTAILNAQAVRLERNDDPEAILSSTRQALLSSRNLAALGDPSLAQLLLRIQAGVQISFTGLGDVYAKASEKMTREAKKGGYNFPPEILSRLITPTRKCLSSAQTFINFAEAGRLRKASDSSRPTKSIKGIETKEEAFNRATNLVEIMAILADEFLSIHGEEKVGPAVSRILIEAFFSTKIHWAEPQLTVQALCQKLIKMRYLETARELVLQARLAKLIDFASELEAQEFYYDLGFRSDLISSHHERILEFNKQWGYFPISLEELPLKARRYALLLGAFNTSHNGQRILGAGASWALNPIFPDKRVPETPLAISINQKDPVREEKANKGGIPFFSPETRASLALTNFAGLPVRLTSIDTIAGPELAPPNRIEAFREITEREIIRVCGHDRKDLTPPQVNPVLIGFRGQDLRSYIFTPKKFEQLQAALQGQELILLVLQGAENISSTLVFNRALDAERLPEEEGREDAFRLLASYVHPGNVDPIQNLAREHLAATQS